MRRNKFRDSYARRWPGLKRKMADLRRRLIAGLRTWRNDLITDGLEWAAERVRFTMERVKEPDSLFDKLSADSQPRWDRAFEGDQSPDLLGGRIVCLTLRDVRDLVERFRDGGFGDLQYSERRGQPKEWLDKPQDSGYRALHFDVSWRNRAGKRIRAEIQCRTLLQDVWGHLGHGVYKNLELSKMIPGLTEQYRDLSDVLYSCDLIIERLLDRVRDARVRNTSIKLGEALDKRMRALASFYASSRPSVPSYSTVDRQDRYRLQGSDVVYDFQIDASAPKRTNFTFPIWGDTPNSKSRVLGIWQLFEQERRHVRRGERHVEKSQDYENLLLVRHNKPAKRHRYALSVRWLGIFSTPWDYVFCPWKTMYGGATVKSTLSLEFEKRPRVQPCLYRIQSIKKEQLSSLWGNRRNIEGGFHPEFERQNGRYVYSFQVPEELDDYICPFRG